MDHQEQHEQKHKKERERDKAAEKQFHEEGERLERKGLGSPRPFLVIVVGVAVTLAIVLSWIFFF